MLARLTVLFGFGLTMGLVYMLCMRATPRRGVMRVIERVCAGIILCYLCALLFYPLGVRLPQGPLSAVSAGYLGLPGLALTAFAQLWP